MVTPLAMVALVWDRRRERATRLLTERTLRLRVGRWQPHLALGTAVSGALMVAMGVLAVVLAVTGPGMPSHGWQTELSARLQHVSSVALHALSWIPGWVLLAVLLLGAVFLIDRALRTVNPGRRAPGRPDDESPSPATADTIKEHLT
ncbi:MAG: putative cytochrome c biosis protein [Mycobacterium sp.]|jgi:cytochrome c-type biogenesis protein|nr:putative cytochrome c biosis protein [Mycobacterium sp.]